MSALGQKQTFAPQEVMSALPPKADICGAATDVRSGPEADIQPPSDLSLEIASSVMDSIGGPDGPSIVFDRTL